MTENVRRRIVGWTLASACALAAVGWAGGSYAGPAEQRPAVRQLDDEPTEQPSDEPTEQPSDEPTEPPTEPTWSPSPRPARSADRPATYTYVDGAAPRDCGSLRERLQDDPLRRDPLDRSQDWCALYVGPDTVDNGEEVALGFRICRSRLALRPGTLQGGRVLHRQWTWLAVATDAHWRWAGASGPAGAAVRVGAGDCAQWSVPWRVADAYGRTLEPGDYVGHTHFFLGDRREYRAIRTVVFRVAVAG